MRWLARLVSTYRAAFAGLPRPIWLLALLALVNRAGSMVIPFVALYLSTQLGYSKEEVGFFLAAFGFGGLTGSALGGPLTDRIGAARVGALSLFAMGALFALFGQLSGTVAIVACLFGIALCAQAFRPAVGTLTAEVCPAELRTRAFALTRLAVNLGMAIGPAAGGFLAVYSYQWLFWIDCLTCVAAGVLMLLWFTGRRATAPVPSARLPGQKGVPPWRDEVFLCVCLLTFLSAMIFFQTFSTLPLFLEEVWGWAESDFGLLFAINPVLIVLFEMVLIHRLTRPNPLRFVGLAGVLLGVGFALFPLGSGFAWGTLCIVILTWGEMLELPLLMGFVANRAQTATRGRYMAGIALTFSLAMICAPVLGTQIAERFDFATLYGACAVLGVAVCIAYQLVAREVDEELAASEAPD